MNGNPTGHNGEGRSDRLNECIVVRKRPIVALSEGIAIQVEDNNHIESLHQISDPREADQQSASKYLCSIMIIQ